MGTSASGVWIAWTPSDTAGCCPRSCTDSLPRWPGGSLSQVGCDQSDGGTYLPGLPGRVQTPLSSLRSLGRGEQHGNTGRMLQARLRCLHTCWFLVRKPRWAGQMRGVQVSGTVFCQWGSSCFALIAKLLLCWKQPWEAWSYICLVMLVVLEEGKPCLHHKWNFQNGQEEVLM